MRVCILCKDENIEAVREKSKELFTKNPENSKNHLVIPVSPSGSEPATHWFCFMNASDDFHNRLLAIQEHTTIENCSPKEFLTKWELKIIK